MGGQADTCYIITKVLKNCRIINTSYKLASAAFQIKMAGVAKKLIPLLDRVLVQRVAAETKTAGGILIPEKAQGKVVHASVIATGPGARTPDGAVIPCSVKPGDQVLLPEFGGTKVEMNDQEYHLFRDTDILGVLQ